MSKTYLAIRIAAALLSLIAFYLHFNSGSLSTHIKPRQAISDNVSIDFSRWKKENVRSK